MLSEMGADDAEVYSVSNDRESIGIVNRVSVAAESTSLPAVHDWV